MTVPPRRRGRIWTSATIVAATAVIAALLATLLATMLAAIAIQAEPVSAQNELTEKRIWDQHAGLVPQPKIWRFRQSVAANDLGSANAAAFDLNDSGWDTKEVHDRWFPGPHVANHFRKDFDLSAIDIELHQVVAIEVEFRYDDAAVLYLNGVEVYRSVRGNLDPEYDDYPVGANIPYDVNVPFGGLEAEYTNIPDPNGENICDEPDPNCELGPYPNANPPAVPVELLREGKNTWAATVWSNSQGNGTRDAQFDHVFTVWVDDDAVAPPTVSINEVMASNDSSYLVQLDDDPNLESPDWIELYNHGDQAVDLGGWTIADASASWTFPAGTTIAAGGFLVIAANDGDDATTTPMQTNFKLSSEGDSLRLTRDDGAVADEYSWIDQFTDNAYGRVANVGDPTYLNAHTPGASNDVAALTDAAPILRVFRDRMFNPGEAVDLDISAFDPDGDTLSYAVTPMPAGVSFDPENPARMIGTFDHPSDLISTITVTDSDGDRASSQFTWFRVDPVTGPAPIVLNEYNAVPASGELLGGSDQGNGGDWFEFLVVADDLDLRGYTIEFRQRDGDTDELRLQTTVTFADRVELARVPAGTIITIGEDASQDLSFDATADWSIHLAIDNDGNGAFFEPAPADTTFNSTRRDQTVLIRDASGTVVTALTGETDGWDSVNRGVGDGEVMMLCASVGPGDTVDPIADYRDIAFATSFGAPNTCTFPDPDDPGRLITLAQNLGPLRGSAGLGAHSGDVTCDLETDIGDALFIARAEVGIVTDTGPCLLDQGGPSHEFAELAGDVNRDGRTTIADALLIARCLVGIPSELCPQ